MTGVQTCALPIYPFLPHQANGLVGGLVPEGRNAGTLGLAAPLKHSLSKTSGHRASTDIADTYEKQADVTHLPGETLSSAAEEAFAIPIADLVGHIARKLPQPPTGRSCFLHQ